MKKSIIYTIVHLTLTKVPKNLKIKNYQEVIQQKKNSEQVSNKNLIIKMKKFLK